MGRLDLNTYSPLLLVYIGDAHYGLTVKRFVIDREVKTEKVQRHANRYVSAKKQREFMERLIADGLLTEEEQEIYRRGRNCHSHRSPKNADPVTYHIATGFEALWGWWYLNDDQPRLEQIWERIRTYEGE